MHHAPKRAKPHEGTTTRNACSNPDSASLFQKDPTQLRAYRKDVSLPAYLQLLSEGLCTNLKLFDDTDQPTGWVLNSVQNRISEQFWCCCVLRKSEAISGTNPCSYVHRIDPSLCSWRAIQQRSPPSGSPESPHNTQTFLASLLLLTWTPECTLPSAGVNLLLILQEDLFRELASIYFDKYSTAKDLVSTPLTPVTMHQLPLSGSRISHGDSAL